MPPVIADGDACRRNPDLDRLRRYSTEHPVQMQKIDIAALEGVRGTRIAAEAGRV